MSEPSHDSIVLPREPFADPAVDVDALQTEGIAALQRLAGRTWTDHNVHDPGRTTLAVLCYALSDLAYRAQGTTENLVAPPPNQRVPSSFFTAREALTCAPVTVEDFRKLLIDIEGVRNAWLEIDAPSEVELSVDIPGQHLHVGPPAADRESVALRGLYRVYLELDADLIHGDLDDPSTELELSEHLRLRINPERWSGPEHDALDVAERASTALLVDGWAAGRRIRSQMEQLQAATVSDFDLYPSGDGHVLYIRTQLVDADNARLGYLFLRAEGLTTGQDIGTWREEVQRKLSAQSRGVCTRLIRRIVARQRRRAHILERAHRRLHAHRPLCTDFPWLSALSVVELGVCATIDVAPDIDLDRLHAEVLLKLWQVFSPPPEFNDLDSLIEAGFDPSEIFEGPRLKHGFPSPGLLEEPLVHDRVYASELIDVLQDLTGVIAIHELSMSSYVGGEVQVSGEPWCLKLPTDELRFPRFSRRRSRIRYRRNSMTVAPRSENVINELRILAAAEGQPRLPPHPYDFEPPTGEWQALAEYTSIQRHFAQTYGVGEVGITPKAPMERHAQARQFKAYLAIFDQFLANYLGQLAAVREGLSVHDDPAGGLVSTPTYDAPDLLWLLKKFVANYPPPDPREAPSTEEKWRRDRIDQQQRAAFAEWSARDNDYSTALQDLIQDRRSRIDRRLEVLDHLLARHGETLADYSELSSNLHGDAPSAKLVRDEASFLRHWPETSYHRGNGFDLCRPFDIESGHNRCGMELRIADMLGVPRTQSWPLRRPWLAKSRFEIPSSPLDDADVAWRYELRVPDPRGTGEALVALTNDAPEMLAVAGQRDGPHPVAVWKRHAVNLARYETEVDGSWSQLILRDDEGRVLGKSAELRGQGRAEELRDRIIAELKQPPAPPWMVDRSFRTEDPELGAQQNWQYTLYLPGGDHDEGRAVLQSPGDGILRALDEPHARHDWRAAVVSDGLLNFKLEEGEHARGRLVLKAPESDDVLGMSPTLISEAEADDLRGLIKAWVSGTGADAEGLHVVEHILLRPLASDETTLSIRLDESCADPATGCAAEHVRYDPYSFRISVLLPAWPRRFRNPEFRAHAEQRIRRETPAHIAIKFCWLNQEHMDDFERAWLKFCAARAAAMGAPSMEPPAADAHREALARLVKVMGGLRDSKIASTLHDCEGDAQNNPVVLDHSGLGEYGEHYRN